MCDCACGRIPLYIHISMPSSVRHRLPFAFRLKICKIAVTSCVCQFDCGCRNLFVFHFGHSPSAVNASLPPIRACVRNIRNDKCNLCTCVTLCVRMRLLEIEFGLMHNECKRSA